MAKSGVDHAITAASGFTPAVMEVLKLLVPLVYEKLKSLAWGFDDLKKLEKTFERIQGVLEEAERRQITDISLHKWLNDLRDIAYDVDDVLDDFLYLKETIKGLPNKVCDSISVSSNYSHFKIADTIKDINIRLEKIQEHKVMFQSPFVNAPTTIMVHQGQTSTESTDIRDNTSYVPPDDSLIGRDNDKLEIVKLLTSFSSQSEKLPVISIVGAGGVGKTALAQFVCKDELVVKCFGKLICWVNVSENFDVNRVLREVIDQVTQSKRRSDDSATLQILSDELHENLRGKNFLLILDDLWNEDGENWKMLKDALMTLDGTEGSKILVTARNDQAASTVRGTIDPYSLKKLTIGECWSIIMERAFAKGGATETSLMFEVGKQIAGKCGGLPLVSRTLGSLMHTKNTLLDWETIEANDVFNIEDNHNKVISILKLSYDNFSPQLKRCFSYCCIFPKHISIERVNLIHLWMAEGFFHQSGNGNRYTMECMGNACFQHLLQCSFFQDVEMDKFGRVYKFKMHDLIHDLARHVLDSYECSVLKTNDDREYNSEGRRVQVAFDADDEISLLFQKSLAGAIKLRTIIALQGNSLDPQIEMFLANKHVRILYVMFRSDIRKCLASISKLRHLRYLNLTHLAMDYPPEYLDLSLNRAITALFHLQTLVLRSSGIKKLPEDIGSLKNLRHLDLGSNKALEGLPDSITSLSNLQTLNLNECGLTCLPEEIGALKHLRYLDLSKTKIKELPESITGCCHLEVLDLESCSHLVELPIAFGALSALTFLNFAGTRIKVLPESCNNGLNSLEVLRVPLFCQFYAEVKNWIHLKHFIYPVPGAIQGLSGIGRLTSLQNLHTSYSLWHNNVIGDLGELNLLAGNLEIRELQNVRGGAEEARRANLKRKENITRLSLVWGYFALEDVVRATDVSTEGFIREEIEEEVLEELQPHPNLRELSIENFPGVKLPSWLMGNDISLALPNLVEIQLRYCPRCEQLFGLGQLPSLKKLVLRYMKNLKEWAEQPLPLSVTATTHYPYLEVLEIIACHKLSVVPASTFPSLTNISIQCVSKEVLCSLLGNNLTSLTKAKVGGIFNLEFLPVEIWQPGLEWLEAHGFPEFQGFVRIKEECSFYLSRMASLRKVLIHFSNKWKPLKDLQHLPHLEELEISCFDHENEFGELLEDGVVDYKLYVSSSLRLPPLPADADEEAEGIQHLTSLRSLRICRWPRVNYSLPHQLEHLTGLRELTIQHCHRLVVLPEWLRNFSSLERLYVEDCPQLEYTYADREGVEYQKISHIKSIYGLGGRVDK